MLPAELRERLEQSLGTIRRSDAIGGGDISSACRISTDSGQYFVKFGTTTDKTKTLYEAEQKGLDLLRSAGVLRIPEVILCDAAGDIGFLVLGYIPKGRASESTWEDFGMRLAAIHKHTAGSFGLDHDNFIGSLPQSNTQHDFWPEFYIEERLQPQLRMASAILPRRVQKGLEHLMGKLESLLDPGVPSLIHGDLWNGNFMVDDTGHVYLIDPAVCYAHREMDLAMSKLFGGFDRKFYDTYEKAWPLAPGMDERIPLYQLYYLLVHVNLFGGSYVGSVEQIVRRYGH